MKQALVTIAEIDKSSLDERTLHLLHGLVMATPAQIIVEAGTYRGNFACIAGSVAKANGGKVYTADAIDYAWGGMLVDNDLVETVRFVHADFAAIIQVAPQIIGNVDFALVDSGPPCAYGWDHEMRFRHYELAKAWVKPGGVVVVDDVNATDWFGVDIIRKEAALVFPLGHGISVWQKPCTPSPAP